MANTFELIASSTVGSGGAANINFSSIPSTYTDLCVKFSGRTNQSAVIDGTKIRFNNDNTSGNYTARRLYADGSAAFSDTNNLGNFFSNGNTSTANTFSNCDLYIPNYTSTNARSYATENAPEENGTTQYYGIGAQLWSDTTTAINQITLSPESGTAFLQYSTAYLYGVKNA
jgi:hypothetical protein